MGRVLCVQCKAMSKTTGERCKRKAIPGGEVCRYHGGSARQVRVAAGVAAEVMAWGLHELKEDPGEVLLRLVAQSARRAQRYAQELEALVAESPSLREALVAETWVATEKGDLYKTGEYIRGLARLEAEERDRCANFAAKAVAAGLNERMVRLAEQQGQLIAQVIRAVLGRAGLTPEQEALVDVALREELMAVSS